MSDRDFANYSELFDLMMSLVGLPDLLIYIRSTIPNLIALLLLSKVAAQETNKYLWGGRLDEEM